MAGDIFWSQDFARRTLDDWLRRKNALYAAPQVTRQPGLAVLEARTRQGQRLLRQRQQLMEESLVVAALGRRFERDAALPPACPLGFQIEGVFGGFRGENALCQAQDIDMLVRQSARFGGGRRQDHAAAGWTGHVARRRFQRVPQVAMKLRPGNRRGVAGLSQRIVGSHHLAQDGIQSGEGAGVAARSRAFVDDRVLTNAKREPAVAVIAQQRVQPSDIST